MGCKSIFGVDFIGGWCFALEVVVLLFVISGLAKYTGQH